MRIPSRQIAFAALSLCASAAWSQVAWILAASPGVAIEISGERLKASAGAGVAAEAVITGAEGDRCVLVAMSEVFTIDFFPFNVGDFFSEPIDDSGARMTRQIVARIAAYAWSAERKDMILPSEAFEWAIAPGAIPERWLSAGFHFRFSQSAPSHRSGTYAPLSYALRPGVEIKQVLYWLVGDETGKTIQDKRAAAKTDGEWLLDISMADFPRYGAFKLRGYIATNLGMREFCIPFSLLSRAEQAQVDDQIRKETATDSNPRWNALIAAYRWLLQGCPLLALEQLQKAGIPTELFFPR
jgi:hypothetical protein